VSRWKREGEWLHVELQTERGPRRVSLRWNGAPGAKVVENLPAK